MCLASPKPHIMSGDPNRVQFSFFLGPHIHVFISQVPQFRYINCQVAINNNHLLFHSNFMWTAHCPKAVFPQIHRCKATEGRDQSVNIVWISWARQQDNSPVPMCCVFLWKGAGNAFCVVHLWRASCVLTPNLSNLLIEARVPNSEKLCKVSGYLILLDHISTLDQLLEQEFFLLWGIICVAAEFVPFSLIP